MSDSMEKRRDARAERVLRAREKAQAALDAVRKARAEFSAEGAAAVVKAQLTPDPKASRFRESTLHKALRPFTQLGQQVEACSTEPQ